MILTLPQTYEEMIAAMLRCEQTKGQTVYQHGLAVSQNIHEIIDFLKHGTPLDGWRVPDWLKDFGPQILANLHDEQRIHQYALLHDCGKPFCKEVDSEGKVHFPDHAKVSKEVYLAVGKDPIVARLIGWDMILHTAMAEDVWEYCEGIWTIQDAFTLLIASLAEIHANSKLFGGIESVSFKSKFKKLDRRGNQICKHMFRV